MVPRQETSDPVWYKYPLQSKHPEIEYPTTVGVAKMMWMIITRKINRCRVLEHPCGRHNCIVHLNETMQSVNAKRNCKQCLKAAKALQKSKDEKGRFIKSTKLSVPATCDHGYEPKCVHNVKSLLVLNKNKEAILNFVKQKFSFVEFST